MGDRGQVKIIGTDNAESPNLYFYTHWGATSLENYVSDALDRGRGRWNDKEYLNRIIFSEMIKDEVLSDIGFGIGFELHGDTWKLVVVNHLDKTVGIQQINYDNVDWENYNSEDVVWEWSQEPIAYEEFVFKYSGVVI